MPWLKWLIPAAAGGALLLFSRKAYAVGDTFGPIPYFPDVDDSPSPNDKKLKAAIGFQPLLKAAAAEWNVPVAVLGGICDAESTYGLNLPASGAGFDGQGWGLMQIDERSHGAWLKANNWRDPLTSFRKGAEILATNIKYFQRPSSGSLTLVERRANGAIGNAAKFGVAAGSYPDPRPLTGWNAIRAGIAAYNAGPSNTLDAIAATGDYDRATWSKDYSARVLTAANWWNLYVEPMTRGIA